eukprot:4506194-Alexandrium_andersonii.AAC.1
MLEVLCPGVPITEGVRNYFKRFHTRPSGKSFRAMVDEQYALIEEKLRATLDINVLTNAAAALGGLFGVSRSRWGMMSKDDKNYIEDIIAKLVVKYSEYALEMAQAGGPADAGAA